MPPERRVEINKVRPRHGEPSATTLGVAKPNTPRQGRTKMQPQQYVGIDLHRRRSVIVRRSGEGETLEVSHVDNDDLLAFERAVMAAGEQFVTGAARLGDHRHGSTRAAYCAGGRVSQSCKPLSGASVHAAERAAATVGVSARLVSDAKRLQRGAPERLAGVLVPALSAASLRAGLSFTTAPAPGVIPSRPRTSSRLSDALAIPATAAGDRAIAAR